jgi:hypothetical protein
MRILFLICLAAMFSNSGSNEKQKITKTYYYYCDSHSMNRQDVTGKEYILYSKVKKIECEPEDFKQLAVLWGNYANRTCKNMHGCTSDLNWYETFNAAEKEFKKIEKTYSDTTKYSVKVIDPIVCFTEQ